jgi:alanine racemase
MSTDPRARAWVDVSASALKANYRLLQEAAGEGGRVIPMVKADGYGLGMAQVLAALEPMDPWAFGVAAVEEGLRVRELGVRKPVIVLSPLPPLSYEAAVRAGLSVAVGNLEGLDLLADAARRAGLPGRFHLDVDTGMGRAGFDWHRVASWAPALSERLSGPLLWEGCFTHFHSADSAETRDTLTQWARFREVVEALPSRPEDLLLHACNSPGALRLPGFAADAVRPGIFLYGGVAGEELPPPTPVAALRARIAFIRAATAGSTVGYGATYAAAGEERWATAAIGYGDGLPRLLSNRGEGLIHGRRAPIIGRISMDVTVLDVTHLRDVAVGDVVTFFGRDGQGEISLEEVAAHAQTINYEVLTGLTQRVPRIWTDHGGY